MPWWGWVIIAYVVLATIKIIVRKKRKQKQKAQNRFTDED